MKKTTLFIFLAAIVVLSLNAQEKGPIAISPASDEGIARVGVNSPTFSWTAVEWATGYKVAVFETNGPNVLTYKEMEAIASPLLKKEIQGQALSWTPSSDERLISEEMYVWYVQAVDGYGTGMWSEGRMFKVELEISLVGIEETVRESLRIKGMSEEVIDDVLEEMRLGMREVVAYGIDTEGSASGDQDIISIQGTEDTTNTFYGLYAGSNSTGTYNSFFGRGAGKNSTAGTNTFMGYFAGRTNTSGYGNTFMGYYSGYSNTSGFNNIFIGYRAGRFNTTGYSNTFLGIEAGTNNTDGYYNTFLGYNAGYSNTSGFQNTFIGRRAGYSNVTANANTFLGYNAGYSNTFGSSNVFIGNQAGFNETGSSRLYIDNSSTSSPLIWGNFSSNILTVHGKLGVGTKSPAYQMEVETTGENAILLIDRTDGATTGFSASGDKCAFGTLSNHPLWMVINGAFSAIFHTDGSLEMMNGAWCTAAGKWQDASSRELKENIQSLTVEEAEDALEGLEPVRFNYKADADDESLGFIAEDVPELVASKDRKSMSAMDVVAVLTKVLQEQQKLVEDQQKAIDELQEQVEELKKGSK
jgi:hypothetical protein